MRPIGPYGRAAEEAQATATNPVARPPMAGSRGISTHMVHFLVEGCGVSANDIEVVFGRFAGNKQLRIKSPPKPPVIVKQYVSRERLYP